MTEDRPVDVDRQALMDLTVSYCWILDTGQHERLAEVFVPDGVAVYAGQRFDGVDAIRAKVSESLSHLDASQHIVANHQVRLDSDTATGRCYFQAQHVRAAAPGGGANFIVAGTYTDEFVRTHQGWRIRHRVLDVLWTEGNPAVTRRA